MNRRFAIVVLVSSMAIAAWVVSVCSADFACVRIVSPPLRLSSDSLASWIKTLRDNNPWTCRDQHTSLQWPPSLQPAKQDELCHIISTFDEVYFVGDSIARQLFGTFAMILARDSPAYTLDDLMYSTSLSKEQQKLCVLNAKDGRMPNDYTCREALATAGKGKPFCDGVEGMERPVKLKFWECLYTRSGARSNPPGVAEVLDKPRGMVIVVGGLHLNLTGWHRRPSDEAVEPPAMLARLYESIGGDTEAEQRERASRVIFLGLHGAGRHTSDNHQARQSAEIQSSFMQGMGAWLAERGIPTLDMTPLVQSADETCEALASQDGAHAPFVVNVAKAHLLGRALEAFVSERRWN